MTCRSESVVDEPMTLRDNILVLAVGLVGVGAIIASIYSVGALLMLTVGKI